MPAGIFRHELRRLAEAKLAAAELLLAHGHDANAFYLAGYAVEIGLKAVVSMQFAAETLPDPKFVRSISTHSLYDLIGVAGLKPALSAELDANPAFSGSWTLVSSWSEQARYCACDRRTAEMMVEAVGSPTKGAPPWLRTRW